MIEIEKIFDSIVSQNRSADTAESDFKKMINEDRELKKAYKEWCAENGYTTKYGFLEYCNKFMDEEQSKWNVFQDYDS